MLTEITHLREDMHARLTLRACAYKTRLLESHVTGKVDMSKNSVEVHQRNACLCGLTAWPLVTDGALIEVLQSFTPNRSASGAICWPRWRSACAGFVQSRSILGRFSA